MLTARYLRTPKPIRLEQLESALGFDSLRCERGQFTLFRVIQKAEGALGDECAFGIFSTA